MPAQPSDTFSGLIQPAAIPVDSLDDFFDSRAAYTLVTCIRASIAEQRLPLTPANALPYTIALLIEFLNSRQKGAKSSVSAAKVDSVQSLTALLVVLHNILRDGSSETKSFLLENHTVVIGIIQSLASLSFSVYAKMEKTWRKQSAGKYDENTTASTTKHQFALCIVELSCGVCRAFVPTYGTQSWWIELLPKLFPSLSQEHVEQRFLEHIFPLYAGLLIETIQGNCQRSEDDADLQTIFPCEALVTPLFEAVSPLSLDNALSHNSQKLHYARNHTVCTVFSSIYAPQLLQALQKCSNTNTTVTPAVLAICLRTLKYFDILCEAITAAPSNNRDQWVASMLCAFRLAAAVFDLCSCWKYLSLSLPVELRHNLLSLASQAASMPLLIATHSESIEKALSDAVKSVKVAVVKCFMATDVLRVFSLVQTRGKRQTPTVLDENASLRVANYDLLDIFDAFLTNDDMQTFVTELVPIAQWCYASHMELKGTGDELNVCTVDMSVVFYKIWTLAGAFARGISLTTPSDTGVASFFKEITQTALLKSVWMCPFACDAIIQAISRSFSTLSISGIPHENAMLSDLRTIAKNVIPRLCNALLSFHTQLNGTQDAAKTRLEAKISTKISLQRCRLLEQMRSITDRKAHRQLESATMQCLRAQLYGSTLSSHLVDFHRQSVEKSGNAESDLYQHAQGMLLHAIGCYARIASLEDSKIIAKQLTATLHTAIDSIFGENFAHSVSTTAGNIAALTQLCVVLADHVEQSCVMRLVEVLMQKVNQLMLSLQTPSGTPRTDRSMELIAFHCNFLALFLISRWGLTETECVRRVNFIHACGHFVSGALMEKFESASHAQFRDLFSVSLRAVIDEPTSLWSNPRILCLLLRELMRFPSEMEHVLQMREATSSVRSLCARERGMVKGEHVEAQRPVPFPESHVFACDGGKTFWEVYRPALWKGSVKASALRLACFMVSTTHVEDEVRLIVRSGEQHPFQREVARHVEGAQSTSSSETARRTAKTRPKRSRESDNNSSSDEGDENSGLGEHTARKRTRRAKSGKLRGASRSMEQSNDADAPKSMASRGPQRVGASTSLFRQLYNANRQKQALSKRNRNPRGNTAFPHFRPSRSVYASKRAKGDMKKPNKPDPYAYFPLQ